MAVMKTSWRALSLAIAVAGCAAQAPVAAPAPAPAESETIEPEAPPPPVVETVDPRTLVQRALEPGVEIHAGPVIADDGSSVAWVGRKGVTRARVVVGPGDAMRSEPVALATRAIAAFRVGKSVVAILETLAALDQPAGIHGIDAEPALRVVLDPDVLVELEHADEAGVRAWIARHPPRPPGPVPAVDLSPLAKTLAGGVGALVSPRGVDVIEIYQAQFARVVRHLDRAAAAKLPSPAAVTACASASCCAADQCEFSDGRAGGVSFLLEREDGVLRATRVMQVEPRSHLPSPPLTPRRVDPVAISEGDAVIARAGLHGKALGAAPNGHGGLVVVMRGKQENAPLVAIEEEGALLRVLPIEVAGLDGVRVDVAFADLDGDGRTDLMLASFPTPPFDAMSKGARAFFPFVMPASIDVTLLLLDLASAPLARSATTLDGAIDAARKLPPGSVTQKEACPLIRAAQRASTLRGALAPGAPLFGFIEPGSFAVSALRETPEVFVGEGAMRVDCTNYVCDVARPVCAWNTAPGTDAFTFTRDAKGKLRIAAGLRYRGS